MLVMTPPFRCSWDLDFADARDGRAPGDVGRQEPQGVVLARRVDRPPDLVAAGAARRQGQLVPERADVSLERGEDDTTLVRRVAVLEQVSRHAASLPRQSAADIGGAP